ncbi:MAG: hypothetical protein IT270_07575 [Saprospiraceae bacterium]|nr:hypothetical protein [Saprospiraceae bacterium]
MCKYRFFLQIFAWLCCTALGAQNPLPVSAPKDTIPPAGFSDSVTVDLSAVKISSEGIDDPVDYGAQDSMWFDVTQKQLHLYGKAFVKYKTLDVTAGYILLDYSKNEISAQEFADSSGQLAGLPHFKDGEQEFDADKFRYNFKTQKGIIYEARTRQEDLYILGQRAKFIGSAQQDSSDKAQNVIYNYNSLVTSCDHPEPHFGIRANKLKVIPNKMVITGLSHLEISGVPTPLVLPFGFFPITKTRKAGLIIPRDFEFREAEGLGIKDWGWYQPINDHMDAAMQFSVFVSGSFGATGTLRYNQRYKQQGNFQLRYNNRVSENSMAQKVSQKSFGLTWTHRQDDKAHPTRRFGGSVNIQTNRDQNRNQNDYQSVYQNSLSSNITYSKLFPGKPYQFNAGMTHSQNTQTREMTISLPNINFNVQRIFPFKRKEPVGPEKWYEKFSLNYAGKLQNNFQTVDTLLFTQATLDNARMGIQHTINSDLNLKLFKYINVAPTVRYEENWYPYTIEKQLLDEIRYVYDTTDEGIIYVDSVNTQFGIDTTIRNWGFKSYRTYNAGISVGTALFNTQQFKKGWLRGFRHTMKPSMSIGVGPDFTNPKYDYFRLVETDLRPSRNDTLRYGIFDDGIFGKPSYSPRNVALAYSLGNILEIKVRRDSADKKIRIFDNLSFNGSYSLTADSLRWSPITTGSVFRFFQGILNVTWNAAFDPYVLDSRGRRIDKFMVNETGRLVRLADFRMQFNTGFTVSQVRGMLAGKDASSDPTPPGAASDDLLSLFNNFRISHNFSFARQLIGGTNQDTLVIVSNGVSLGGSIPLTNKWRFNVNNISYDFTSKSIAYPDIGVSRNLHCWELSLSWQPQRGTYTFSINVTPGSSLEFLKLPYRQNNFDSGL